MIPPIIYTWNGDAMEPLPRFTKLCNQTFAVGETYPLVVQETRSQQTHNHFFASVHEAWSNLPENIAEQFPTADHLRKYALIKAGYRDERSIVVRSAAEAQQLAAFIKPMDDYAIVTATAAMVTVYTAKSQSMRAMGGKEFQASKQAVLDVIAGLIGVSADELQSRAGQAA